MVTDEELRNRVFIEALPDEVSMRVTEADFAELSDKAELALRKKIRAKKMEFDKKLNNSGFSSSYGRFAEACSVSEEAVKKTIAGSVKIKRTFLYKMAVGLKMSIEEANEYFELCGGKLRSDFREDYICIRALEDGDDIGLFLEQFKEFVSDRYKKNK